MKQPISKTRKMTVFKRCQLINLLSLTNCNVAFQMIISPLTDTPQTYRHTQADVHVHTDTQTSTHIYTVTKTHTHNNTQTQTQTHVYSEAVIKC